MRKSARAVIIQGEKVLTMFRRKVIDGKTIEYYVIPGGGIEENEESQETVKRELKEEMNIDIEVLSFLGKIANKDGEAFYYHCKMKDDQVPVLGGEELERMTEENFYQPCFVDLIELKNIDIIGVEFILKAKEEKSKHTF